MRIKQNMLTAVLGLILLNGITATAWAKSDLPLPTPTVAALTPANSTPAATPASTSAAPTATSTAAAQAAPIPNNWTPEVTLDAISNLSAAINQARPDHKLTLTLDDNGNITTSDVNSCKAYYQALLKGYEPFTTQAFIDSSFYVAQCGALAYLANSATTPHPAALTFALADDYWQLPAKFIFPPLTNDASNLGSLMSYDPKIEKQAVPKNSSQCVALHSPRYQGTADLCLLAWGNLSGHNKKELLFLVALMPDQGSLRLYSTLLVTWSDLEKRYVEVDEGKVLYAHLPEKLAIAASQL